MRNEFPIGKNELGIPVTWKQGYWGVLQCFKSPSGKQWIRLRYDSWHDWRMGEHTGKAEYISDALRQMARLGYLEGEFD